MRVFRKEGFVFFESWVEISFFALLVLGFGLGKLVVDTALTYILAAAAGMVTGRLGYLKRENDPVPHYAIGAAFLIGLLLGHRVGAGIAMAAVFAAAAFLSYRAHKSLDFLA